MLEENLQLGDRGNDVRILQEKLKILGFYNAIITGDFGLATEVGVKAFQKENGLEETGIVNNEMWTLLFQFTETAYGMLFSDYPILGYGASGTYVRDLQIKLKTLLYYTGEITSFFDIETQNAVKRLQFHNDLTTTGIVNNPTWNLLNTLYGNLSECVTGSTESDYITYIVAPGDSLYKIAQEYNTTIDAIRSLNQLTSDVLQVGQVLKIPVKEENVSTITYTVQPGDTLYSIARKYNITVDAIKGLNNLSSNTLRVGQVLRIPVKEENVSTTTYTVQPGDTLYSIARKYNTTVAALSALNNLSSNTLSVGQVLKIPSTSESVSTTYTVQPGDTLYSIARKYNITVDAIKSLNNLSSNTLRVGQVLKIPSSGDNVSTTTYTVQPGDTLYSVARRYNTTVDAIKSLNGLTSNTLRVGQVLKIII